MFLDLRRREEVEALRGLELGGLCAQAEAFGFWSLNVLPSVQEHAQEGMDVDMMDGYATPPHQILWRQ